MAQDSATRPTPRGLFVGLVTVDIIYLAEAPPGPNQKLAADDFSLAAGGPATNAAVAFAHLGGEATVIGVLGRHALAGLVSAELAGRGIRLLDLKPEEATAPPLSSVVVSRASGDRAVISRNAADRQLAGEALPGNALADADVILVDGHQMALARAVVDTAGRPPLVVDAGSWKPGFDAVLTGADYVIASADFRPPGCNDESGVLAWLQAHGVVHAAVSHGAGAIAYSGPDGSGEVEVPAVTVVDTLAAGDFLHGAFCRYCRDVPFADALARAAVVASRSCGHFGTRAWMEA
jgi:sugar/nucleoside kinase (ribokinase family)